jgi:AbrB family looped-hinge helix DNA binding protein
VKKSTTKERNQLRRDTRLTQKGQVTIPQPIREFLGLKARDGVRFEVVDGRVLVTAAPRGIGRHFASVPVPKPAPDWRAEREAFQQGLADQAEPDWSE